MNPSDKTHSDTKRANFDPRLTKQHFSTKIFKVYLKYIQRHYPEICLEAICEQAGLTYEYIMDETNWVSVIFDRRFTIACIEATNDASLPYKSGFSGLTQEGMGSFLYYLIKYTLSTTHIYHSITSQSLNFSKVMSMEIVTERKGRIHIKYHPTNFERLDEKEQKALLDNLDNIYQNTIGYIARVPTIHNQRQAEVSDYLHNGQQDVPELHLEVRYQNRKPICQLAALGIPAGLLIIGYAVPYPSTPIILTEFGLRGLILGGSVLFMVVGVLLYNYFQQRKIPEETQKTIEKMDRQYRDLQKAKEALKENEELLRKMANNYPNSYVAILEKNFTVSFTSGLEYKKQHLDPDQFIGLPVEEVFPDKEGMARKHYQRTFRGEESCFELSITDQHQLFRTVPLYSKDGSVPRILVVIENITERKHLEARIQQSQKMEAIGTLAGGIAHDFNNLLYAMIGYTEMTLDDIPVDSLAQDNLKTVLKSAMRAKDMVQQILTFSRKTETQRKPLKLQSIVKEALKLLRTSIPTTIEIRQQIDADCGPVLADSTQMHQVVMNLATNAYQAMFDRRGVLAVTLKAVAGEPDRSDLTFCAGRHLQLIVQDSGCGMDEHIMEKIFDPYFSTKAPGEGTGMGLAVVHGIVKDHGGDIRVFSEVGKGTTVQVALPLAAAMPVEVPETGEDPLPKGTEHILIVDDEESIVLMTQQALERLGYRVTSYTSSTEALEVFRRERNEVDLVLTDMTMPHMTGMELAAGLKKIRPDIPIIICTGYSELIDRDQANRLGIIDFVMKPVLKNEMVKTVRRVLDRQFQLHSKT